MSSTRCWHCNGKLSIMNSPTGEPWFAKLTIEPGRTVRVHKCCAEDARRSISKVTAKPIDIRYDEEVS